MSTLYSQLTSDLLKLFLFAAFSARLGAPSDQNMSFFSVPLWNVMPAKLDESGLQSSSVRKLTTFRVKSFHLSLVLTLTRFSRIPWSTADHLFTCLIVPGPIAIQSEVQIIVHLGSHLTESRLTEGHVDSLRLSCRTSASLDLTFRSMVHFGLFFVYGVK